MECIVPLVRLVESIYGINEQLRITETWNRGGGIVPSAEKTGAAEGKRQKRLSLSLSPSSEFSFGIKISITYLLTLPSSIRSTSSFVLESYIILYEILSRRKVWNF